MDTGKWITYSRDDAGIIEQAVSDVAFPKPPPPLLIYIVCL